MYQGRAARLDTGITVYFYAHGASSVKAGDRVRRGQSLGTTGSANGVPHLHFGVEHGDPRQIIGQRR